MKLLCVLCVFAVLLSFLGCSGTKPPALPAPTLHEPPDPNLTRPFVYVEGSRFMFQGEEFRFKGVNYFPVKQNWRNMWLNWDAVAIEKEITLLRGLGVTVVRVFITKGDFTDSENRLNERMISRLDAVLNILNENGMKAIITLFMWSAIDDIERDRTHARLFTRRFRDDERIFGWDISNELDHRWSKHPDKWSHNYVRKWADQIAGAIRANDPNHLVFAGDYGHFLGDRSDWQGSGIKVDLEKMTLPLEKADVLCFHWYGHDRALGVAFDKIRKLTGKPILVEEIGFPTGGIKNGQRWPLSEENVASYQRAWQREASKHGAYLMLWCGFDYDPSTTHFRPDDAELFFGLFDVRYRMKANGRAFRDSLHRYDTDAQTLPINHYERSKKWLKQ